jgi:hypothetical protein
MCPNSSVKSLFEITYNLKPLFSVSWGPAFPCRDLRVNLFVDSKLFWVRVYFLVKSNLYIIPIISISISQFSLLQFLISPHVDHWKRPIPQPNIPKCVWSSDASEHIFLTHIVVTPRFFSGPQKNRPLFYTHGHLVIVVKLINHNLPGLVAVSQTNV